MEVETKEEDSQLFSISVEPSEDTEPPKIYYHHEISLLPSDIEASKNKAKTPSKNASKCWNCGQGNHALRDCKERYNHKEVNKNRQQFQRSYKPPGDFKRYHLEAGEKFPDAKPGVISDKLREALGLNKNQLPIYIYNMRRLGYPPGWLEDCRVGDSGINMLDSNGDRIPNRDEEEGEIYVERQRYDLSKIIEYPGFNVWPPPDTINETDKYYAEPMCFEHSKSEFIKRLKDRMDATTVVVEKTVFAPERVEDDMDTEEIGDVPIETTRQFNFIPPLPEEPLPPPPPESDSDGDEEEEGERDDDEPKKDNKKRKITSENGDSSQDSNSKDDVISTPSNKATHGTIKHVELGTPVLKIHSPFTKLPPPEAFSKEISDVEFFENLPNATGKYEQLKVVLSGVRSRLNSLRENK